MLLDYQPPLLSPPRTPATTPSSTPSLTTRPTLAYTGETVRVDERGLNGRTAFATAVEVDDVAIAELLLSRGADPDPVEEFNETPLYFAVSNGNLRLVTLLIQLGADVNRVSQRRGNTALYMAASKNLPEIAELLLANGAKDGLEEQLLDKHGEPILRTPLVAAIETGDIRLVKLFIPSTPRKEPPSILQERTRQRYGGRAEPNFLPMEAVYYIRDPEAAVSMMQFMLSLREDHPWLFMYRDHDAHEFFLRHATRAPAALCLFVLSSARPCARDGGEVVAPDGLVEGVVGMEEEKIDLSTRDVWGVRALLQHAVYQDSAPLVARLLELGVASTDTSSLLEVAKLARRFDRDTIVAMLEKADLERTQKLLAQLTQSQQRQQPQLTQPWYLAESGYFMR